MILADISKLKINGTNYNLKDIEARNETRKSLSVPIATVDSTSTSSAFTVQVEEFESEPELRDGLFFYITNNVIASAEGWTLQVNDFDAKPVYNVSGSRTTTGFALNRTFPCWYDSSINDGAGAWIIGYLTDTDTNTNTIGYQLRTNSQTLPATQKFYRYRLLFTSADNEHLVPANTSTSTNATGNRTPNQTPINPFGPIYYYGSTSAINANANPGASVLWQQYAITLGYSFAKGAALTMTSYKPVYLKCAPQTDGSAIIDSDTPWVQDLPTTKDGKIYIFLGIAYSATNIELMIWHQVYYHDGTQIRIWTGAELPQEETMANVKAMLSGYGLNTTTIHTEPTVETATADGTALPS